MSAQDNFEGCAPPLLPKESTTTLFYTAFVIDTLAVISLLLTLIYSIRRLRSTPSLQNTLPRSGRRNNRRFTAYIGALLRTMVGMHPLNSQLERLGGAGLFFNYLVVWAMPSMLIGAAAAIVKSSLQLSWSGVEDMKGLRMGGEVMRIYGLVAQLFAVGGLYLYQLMILDRVSIVNRPLRKGYARWVGPALALLAFLVLITSVVGLYMYYLDKQQQILQIQPAVLMALIMRTNHDNLSSTQLTEPLPAAMYVLIADATQSSAILYLGFLLEEPLDGVASTFDHDVIRHKNSARQESTNVIDFERSHTPSSVRGPSTMVGSDPAISSSNLPYMMSPTYGMSVESLASIQSLQLGRAYLPGSVYPPARPDGRRSMDLSTNASSRHRLICNGPRETIGNILGTLHLSNRRLPVVKLRSALSFSAVIVFDIVAVISAVLAVYHGCYPLFAELFMDIAFSLLTVRMFCCVIFMEQFRHRPLYGTEVAIDLDDPQISQPAIGLNQPQAMNSVQRFDIIDSLKGVAPPRTAERPGPLLLDTAFAQKSSLVPLKVTAEQLGYPIIHPIPPPLRRSSTRASRQPTNTSTSSIHHPLNSELYSQARAILNAGDSSHENSPYSANGSSAMLSDKTGVSHGIVVITDLPSAAQNSPPLHTPLLPPYNSQVNTPLSEGYIPSPRDVIPYFQSIPIISTSVPPSPIGSVHSRVTITTRQLATDTTGSPSEPQPRPGRQRAYSASKAPTSIESIPPSPSSSTSSTRQNLSHRRSRSAGSAFVPPQSIVASANAGSGVNRSPSSLSQHVVAAGTGMDRTYASLSTNVVNRSVGETGLDSNWKDQVVTPVIGAVPSPMVSNVDLRRPRYEGYGSSNHQREA
ncbi:hypothetical protein BJ742DRAFT_911620 [Cladochytrium replicatum]|nr:hypothetical protein BJ742DRAFT_911620 [Cladochytrium replicatum]